MLESLKTSSLMILWILSWGVLVLGLGLATKIVVKLFMLGFNLF